MSTSTDTRWSFCKHLFDSIMDHIGSLSYSFYQNIELKYMDYDLLVQ